MMIDFSRVGLVELLIWAAATWRISYAITREYGPFGAFKRLQGLGGESSLPTVFTCIKCASVWVAPVVLALWVHAPVVVLIFAASGLALMLHSYTGAGN